MTNEILFFITAALALGVVSVSALFGRMWLYVTTVTLILITNTVVGKLGLAFGFTAAVGVSTFAGIFLATDILSEFYGKQSAKRAVWLAFFANIVFMTFGFITTIFEGGINPEMDQAISVIFNFLPRVVFAGMTAFVIAQHFDVTFYHFLKKLTNNKHLWLRNIVSTVTSQFLDSVIFVMIAFGPTNPASWDIIFSIWLLKSCVAFADTPFIYFVRYCLERWPVLRDWDKRMLHIDEEK